MKKILLLVALAMFAATVLHAQSGWVTHKGDDRVSVKFPVEPNESSPGSFSATKDGSTIYIFTIVDLAQFGIDSAALAPVKATAEFVAQMKTGMKQKLPDVDLADYTIGTWKGLTSYTTTGKDPNQRIYDNFTFIAGTKMYSLSTVRTSGTDLS